jgi:hypothetical protein
VGGNLDSSDDVLRIFEQVYSGLPPEDVAHRAREPALRSAVASGDFRTSVFAEW